MTGVCFTVITAHDYIEDVYNERGLFYCQTDAFCSPHHGPHVVRDDSTFRNEITTQGVISCSHSVEGRGRGVESVMYTVHCTYIT